MNKNSTRSITLSLTPKMIEFCEDCIDSGMYRTITQVVEDALRHLFQDVRND